MQHTFLIRLELEEPRSTAELRRALESILEHSTLREALETALPEGEVQSLRLLPPQADLPQISAETILACLRAMTGDQLQRHEMELLGFNTANRSLLPTPTQLQQAATERMTELLTKLLQAAQAQHG